MSALVLLAAVTLLNAEPDRAGEPFDYFRNSWSVIGLKDYQFGTRVTPDNELLLADNVRVQIRCGTQAAPISRKQTKTLLDGWLPVVLLKAEEGAVRYECTLWATPLTTVKDWRKAFDWPTEGENYVNWIAVKATNTGPAAATGQVKVELHGKESSTSDAVMSWPLAPGASMEGAVVVPYQGARQIGRVPGEQAAVWLARTVDYWHGVMAGAARIEVPCRKTNETLLAAHVCQLIANDHGEMHAGEGFYDEFYIRDGAYQLMELEEAGLNDAARKAVEFYLRRQRPDGRFETQKDQYDANGQAVWTIWQYAKITGDRAWLERAYPQMRRAVEWTMQARRKAQADSPFAGVLPPAPADGESLWDGKHHIPGYDFWNLRGVLCTADAARQLGKTDESRQLLEEANLYRQAIDAAWQRTGLPHFPPSWEKEGTHWGNTELLWPTEIFPADDPRVAATVDEVRRRHGGGFVEGTIRWTGAKDVIHPYLSAYTTMNSLVRGEHDQVVEDYYWYLLHSSATHAFPEGIFYKRRFAWSDTIPHATGASNFAIMLRHLLIHEQGDELHLLPGAPDGWLSPGQKIVVERAPTHFGPMSLYVEGTDRGVEVKLDRPTRERLAPGRTVLHLPKSRPLLNPLEGVRVVLREDQKQPWDFAGVVKLYREQAPVPKPIAGLIQLPLAGELAKDRCQALDLSRLANTDPLTAPFGVERPGKHLFTGMPVGRQTVAGVPFAILDPAKNEGRGLIVLHSARAPANRAWPKEVEIPVGQQGKRLFFLGNVHGWASDDEGAGPWGAVAEYVIHYQDGQQQVVPWITGRTADDWALPPAADEVFVGLRGDPWHLNVLGVELRPAPVTKIVFRDLGTPAAPVLAAVTLEK